MRVLLIIGIVLVVAALLLWPRKPSSPERRAAETTTAEAPTAANPPPADPERERARERLQQMKTAFEKLPPARSVVETRLERRPGESQAFFEERTRAMSEFHHFVRDQHLSPDREQALMRVLADAQDSWKLALEQAGRRQPEAQGAEVADAVLSQIYLSINEEVQQRARGLLEPAQAALFQSYLPSVLPYLRTRPFEGRSP